MFVNLNDIAILNINGADYCCIINGISKSNNLNLLQNANLLKHIYYNIFIIKYLLKHILPYIK